MIEFLNQPTMYILLHTTLQNVGCTNYTIDQFRVTEAELLCKMTTVQFGVS